MIASGQNNPGNDLEKACAWYCFGKLIQCELDELKEAWNSHYIRRSQHSEAHGRPDMLFFCPPTGFIDNAFSIASSDFDVLKSHLDDDWPVESDHEEVLREYFEYLSEHLQLSTSISFEHGRSNYLYLMSLARFVENYESKIFVYY